MKHKPHIPATDTEYADHKASLKTLYTLNLNLKTILTP